MKEILDHLTKHFIFLFEEKNFKIINSEYYSKEAAKVTLTCEYFFIRLYQERDHTFMDIGSVFDNEAYADSFWIKKIILQEANPDDNTVAALHALFLRTQFEKIVALFAAENYKNTIQLTKQLYKERWS